MVATAIWQGLVTGFKAAVEWLDKSGKYFTFILGPIGILISMIKVIAEQWDNIRTAFSEGGILEGIKAIGRALLLGILAPIEGILTAVSKIPGVGKLTAGALEGIQNFRMQLEAANEPTRAPMSPAERSSITREESYSTGELTIRDQTGRAEMTRPPARGGYQIKLMQSGEF